jgi:serine/threonine-protein kinase
MNQEDLLHPSVRPGSVLAGKYSVERVLGAGGMGVVVVAVHVDLYERVALKFLLPEAVGHEQAVQRFSREARAAFKIKSEHVARVIDVGTLDIGAPYMVMEFLEGRDLDAVLEERGALPIQEAVEYMLQACEAIAEAHTLGIVHRDLKPANLFLVRRRDGSPCIKVLDFGLSKVGIEIEPQRKGFRMTGTKQMLGSPLYMSPEQMLSSKDADIRSDIWSLGVILFEMITGSLPFEADALPQLRAAIMSGSARSLLAARPDAPPGLAAVFERCFQKDRNYRYNNVADFAVALAPFGPPIGRLSAERIARMTQAAGMPVAVPPPPAFGPTIESPSRGAGAASGGALDTVKTLPEKAKRLLAAVIVGVALVSALVAGVTVSACSSDSGPPAKSKWR